MNDQSLFRDEFSTRHLGLSDVTTQKMVQALSLPLLSTLIDQVVPRQIRFQKRLNLPEALTETEALQKLRDSAQKNEVRKNFIGTGYYGCHTPGVIQRNVLENPGWYTQYTPYQAEISQGRLEALLNFQTLVSDLTALPIANASLLDEATAAAEAMTFCHALAPAAQGAEPGKKFFVSHRCHPQTIEVVQTRAEPLGILVEVGDVHAVDWSAAGEAANFGVLLQYPATDGTIENYESLIARAHQAGALVVMATDLLALTVLKPPGEMGADVAVGSAQRFGVPMGFGGPHAAFFATRDEYKRRMPGRIIGVSKDAEGRMAYRLALQTREQHIRRDKATSNICTAQVLLAVMASMYAVYHGPERLRAIAGRIQKLLRVFELGLSSKYALDKNSARFDTVVVDAGANYTAVVDAAERAKINLRLFAGSTQVGVSLDETTTRADVDQLWKVFGVAPVAFEGAGSVAASSIENSTQNNKTAAELSRKSKILQHPVFNQYHTETEMLRYIRRLESRDLSLTSSMIPLGSCTMKLNASAEMFPVSWPEFSSIHPFAPRAQVAGYLQMISELERDLAEVTGFDGVSLQPNSGAQGEYAGLLVIRKHHLARGQGHRTVCLIPKSAHGTNPASAALAGMKVVVVECDSQGNVDLADLRAKATEHAQDLAALMVTYPSTHGVFESGIREICEIVHSCGGQVYMDGANLNAQLGLCRPGDYGPDVCHLNLHKTFCIPHGGGGPGMGPIAVKKHLSPYLPGRPGGIGAVSAAPFGSASILPISWMYIRMMGPEGLKRASEVAILNANYIAHRLNPHYPVLYRGENGFVAHECIVDLRPIKSTTGIEVEDVAKRLMDYGFHAPTVSFPVAGTLMIEPTESESLAELDRFCEAMILIRKEIAEIESGKMDRVNNPLKRAPHTAGLLAQSAWDRPYSRERAVFPAEWTREGKFWPFVGRIDNVAGDRNLICTCPSVDDYR